MADGDFSAGETAVRIDFSPWTFFLMKNFFFGSYTKKKGIGGDDGEKIFSRPALDDIRRADDRGGAAQLSASRRHPERRRGAVWNCAPFFRVFRFRGLLRHPGDPGRRMVDAVRRRRHPAAGLAPAVRQQQNRAVASASAGRMAADQRPFPNGERTAAEKLWKRPTGAGSSGAVR